MRRERSGRNVKREGSKYVYVEVSGSVVGRAVSEVGFGEGMVVIFGVEA